MDKLNPIEQAGAVRHWGEYRKEFMGGLPKGSRILDIGMGSGTRDARYFVREGYNVTGIDLKLEGVDHLEYAKKHGVNSMEMDMNNLDFPEGSFDGIWFANAIIFAKDRGKVINDCFRILKPGGKLFLCDNFFETKKPGDSEPLFPNIKMLEDAGFAIEKEDAGVEIPEKPFWIKEGNKKFQVIFAKKPF